MAGEDRVLAGGAKYIDFQTDPSRYRHWKLDVAGDVATLTMDVDENAGLFEGYQLKLNSYDLGVDIELADALQRMRFEHPEVKVVILRSGKERVFCAGANIRMLAGSTHAHKVNFCKFTNETRNGKGKGIALTPLDRRFEADSVHYSFVTVEINRAERIATITIKAPEAEAPTAVDAMAEQGALFWPLQVARELDDAILHLRINELETAALVFKTIGESAKVLRYDALLHANKDHWLANEILHYWKRVLKRVDVTSRTLVAL